jgi:hypothetical protein
MKKATTFVPRATCLCCNATLPPERRFSYPPGCDCLKLPPGERCEVCAALPTGQFLGFCDQHCHRTFLYNNPKGLVGKLVPLRPINNEPKPMPEEVKELLRERAREKRIAKGPAKPKVADADLEARYGPKRAVKKIIEKTDKGGAVRALLVCGHNKTVHHDGVKEARCKRCLGDKE